MNVLWLVLAVPAALLSLGLFAVWFNWNNPDTTWAWDDPDAESLPPEEWFGRVEA